MPPSPKKKKTAPKVIAKKEKKQRNLPRQCLNCKRVIESHHNRHGETCKGFKGWKHLNRNLDEISSTKYKKKIRSDKDAVKFYANPKVEESKDFMRSHHSCVIRMVDREVITDLKRKECQKGLEHIFHKLLWYNKLTVKQIKESLDQVATAVNFNKEVYESTKSV